jgi:hypothetical protein
MTQVKGVKVVMVLMVMVEAGTPQATNKAIPGGDKTTRRYRLGAITAPG